MCIKTAFVSVHSINYFKLQWQAEVIDYNRVEPIWNTELAFIAMALPQPAQDFRTVSDIDVTVEQQ